MRSLIRPGAGKDALLAGLYGGITVGASEGKAVDSFSRDSQA